MTQKPDSTKIDAALRRAAYKAVHGTREERAGRFVPVKTRTASAERVSKKSKMNRRKA